MRTLAVLAVMLAVASATTFEARADVWTFAGTRYPDRASAEAARVAQFKSIVDTIPARDKPVAGTVRLVIPGRDLSGNILRDRYGQVYDRFSAGQKEYIREMSYAEMQLVVDMVRKRNIFERVQVVELPGDARTEHVNPAGDEIAIYYYAPDKTSRSWYYRSAKVKLTPLHTDTGNPDVNARYRYFVDSIEALAAGERP